MADNPARMEIARLVVDHHGEVYRYAYHLTGSSQDAEDLTQQTFLAAMKHWSQLRAAENARAWLYAILRNGYLKGLRKRAPQLAVDLELDVGELPGDVGQEPEHDRERLHAAIQGLADEFKLVLLMFYFEECSYRQIAGRLGVPLGTVMSRLSRAKRQLRGLLCERELQTSAARGPGALHESGGGHG